VLDADERRRADAFRRVANRALFVAAHVERRRILARYLDGTDAAGLRFRVGPHGKPSLDGAALDLRFNLAHTDGLVLVAVGLGVEVGVDGERRSDRPVDDALLDVAFAPEERAAVRALDEPARRRAFFATWARREAYLKALGVGLTIPVEEAAVSVDPDAPATVVRPWREARARFALVDLPVGDEWAAALAVEAQPGAPPIAPRLFLVA